MVRKIKILKVIVSIIFILLSFYAGYLFRKSEESVIKLDFEKDSCGSLIYSSVSAFVRTRHETKNLTDYKLYFDTLSPEIKENIWCYSVTDEDFLCIYNTRHVPYPNQQWIPGFTKDKYIIFERKEVEIKNNFFENNSIYLER